MLLNSKRHIDRRGNISQQLFYYTVNVCFEFPVIFRPLKPLTLRMHHANLFDILMSIPVSHAILPCVLCFAMSCRQPVQYIVRSAAVDRHLGQSEDV